MNRRKITLKKLRVLGLGLCSCGRSWRPDLELVVSGCKLADHAGNQISIAKDDAWRPCCGLEKLRPGMLH